MYAETWPFFSYLQSFSLHELPHFIPKIDARGNIVQMPALSEYDLGGEGDLFKAPKPIIEEPGVGFDTMTTTISMLSGGKDIPTNTIQVTDIESIDSKQLSERGLVPTSSVLEYDLGGGDLFKAPETVIEEPALGFDAITTTVSMIPVCEDVISVQAIKVADIESIQREHLLNEVFYECKKDLLEKSALDGSFSEVSGVKIPVMLMEDTATGREKLIMSGPIHKSLSSESLSSMEWIGAGAAGTRLLDFPVMDLRAAFGMRRAFSESDIKTLGDQKTSHVHSHPEQILTISNCPIEDRWQKLSRYRKKKTKRNFDRKIKYACRKALADNQPRIRGRFAKTG